jgi:hypothetical protein
MVPCHNLLAGQAAPLRGLGVQRPRASVGAGAWACINGAYLGKACWLALWVVLAVAFYAIGWVK